MWLTSADKTKIHGYWVPCVYLREEEESEELNNETVEELANDIRKPNNYPTMIFCSPNAGFAEFF